MNSHYFNSHDIEVSIRSFSPAQADSILSTINIGNRKVSRERVATYLRDMNSGSWEFNGDAIRLDENGVLIDGQHRMTAVAQSGMACEFLVIKGVKSATKHTIDSGKSRTGGDALSIQAGVAFGTSHTLSGALTMFEKYKKSGFGGAGGGNRLTTSQILNAYDERRDLVELASSMMKEISPATGSLLPKAEVLFLFMVFCELDEQDAATYMSRILTGGDISADSIEMHIRAIMLNNKMKLSKLSKASLINSILKCWNVARRGGQIKHRGNCVWRPISEKVIIAK
jgi:hypothetical protein